MSLFICYSLIGTCYAKDFNPIKYISWILKKVVTDKVTPDAVKWLPHHIDTDLLDDQIAGVWGLQSAYASTDGFYYGAEFHIFNNKLYLGVLTQVYFF